MSETFDQVAERCYRAFQYGEMNLKRCMSEVWDAAILSHVPAREESPSLVGEATGKPPALGLNDLIDEVARLRSRSFAANKRIDSLDETAKSFACRLTALERDRATPPFMESYERIIKSYERAIETRTALDQRNVAPPTPAAAELLREVVEAYSVDGLEMWFEMSENEGAMYQNVARALTAAREYVNRAGKGDSSQRPNGEAPQTEAPSSDRRTVADRPFPAPSPDAVAGNVEKLRFLARVMRSYSPSISNGKDEDVRGEFLVNCDRLSREIESLIHTAYTARGGAFTCVRCNKKHDEKDHGPAYVYCQECAPFATPTALGGADLYRVKTKRQYSAHGLRIDEVMSDASERHVDSIRWDELLGQHKDYHGPCSHIARGGAVAWPPGEEWITKLALWINVNMRRKPVDIPTMGCMKRALERVGPPTAHVAGGGETPVHAAEFARRVLARLGDDARAWASRAMNGRSHQDYSHEGLADLLARFQMEMLNAIRQEFVESRIGLRPSPTPPASASSAFGEAVDRLLSYLLNPGVLTNKMAARGSMDPGYWISDGLAERIDASAREVNELRAALSATRGEAGEAEWFDETHRTHYKLGARHTLWHRAEGVTNWTEIEARGFGEVLYRRLLSLTRAPSREGEKP